MADRLSELTLAQWEQVRDLRAEWLAHGTSTAPADRPTAEAAVTEMYRLIGKPAPQFIWVDSPATANLAMWLLDGKQGASLRDSLGASLGDSLRDSLGDSLRDSLRASLGDSLRDSLRASLGDSLRDSLGASLRASLGASLGASLRASLGDSLRASLGASLRASLGASLRASRQINWHFFSGQHDAYWVAHYQVPEKLGIVTYAPESSRRLALWADIARSCGWWWPFDGMVVMSERPAEVHLEPWAGRTEGEQRLHRADGPALLYRDGWAVHAWHGVRVPADLIEGDGWTPEQILRAPNQEHRRAAIERMGWGQFIRTAQLVPAGPAVADPGNPGGELTLYDLPEQLFDEPVRVLLCLNGTVERDGTRRRYGLTVPAEITDPVAAAAWTYDIPAAAYRQLEVRT